MKKKLTASLLLCAALLLPGLPICARAEAQLDYVNDYAGLLSDEARAALNDRAARIAEDHACGVYVVTVDDYTDYVNGDIGSFSEEIYKAYELGVGEGRSGILLALSMEGRDFDLCAYGDFGNYAFTDYGKEQLEGSFLDNFRENDWEGGFADYIDSAGVLIERARNGDPLDRWIADPPAPAPRGITPVEGLLILLFPSGIGAAVVGGFRRQMKTAVRRTGASDYVDRGGVELREKQDQFINRSVSRRTVRKDPPSSSSGRSGGHWGGTSVNSGGFSHSSGKF